MSDDIYEKAYEKAASGVYEPGAWTPARCAMFRLLENRDHRKWFEAWIMKEREQGFHHPHELPKPRKDRKAG